MSANAFRSPTAQAGLSLVEISLALALVGLSTAWLARNLERDSHERLAQAEAQTLSALQKGMQLYLDEYAMQFIQSPDTAVQRQVSSTDAGIQTVRIAAGSDNGQSTWPTVDQLKSLQIIPATLITKSLVSDHRDYVTGAIQSYSLSDDVNPLGHFESCLQDGCVIRMIAFPSTASLQGTETQQMPASLQASLLKYLGPSGLMAHADDGKLLSSNGQEKGVMTDAISHPGDIGVYAEVRIPSLSQRKLNQGLACEPGYFGFNASTRSPTDATELAASSPSRCVAPHGHIPVGQQVMAYDLRTPYTGHVRLVCDLSSSTQTLTVTAAQDATDPLGPVDLSCVP